MNWKRGQQVLCSITLISILLVIDQCTKILAATHLQGSSGVDLLEGIFRLQYLENRGAAFGILQDKLIFFYLLTPCVLILVGCILYNLPLTKKFLPLSACSVLLIAGALGNYIDRIRLGYVIDFLYFELIDFPIFNVADIYVCVAVGLYMILLLFYYREEELDMIKLFRK